MSSGIVNTTTWRATDTLTVKNIASYTQLTSDQRNDVVGTNFTIPSVLNTPVGPVAAGALAGLPVAFIQLLGGTNRYKSIGEQYTASEEFQ